MKVKAVKIIRSAAISGHHIHKPGELGEVLSTSTDIAGRTTMIVKWADGERCVVLPSDIEAFEGEAPSQTPATTDSSATPSEAASSSRSLVRHMEHAGRSGQEPVGTLPHFCFNFKPSWATSLWFEMGGEG